ncbi:hypothetical protein [uncultured Nostoc sp.]
MSGSPTYAPVLFFLKCLFENAPPTPPDFDPDQARWEALKEKHNL